MQTNQTQDLSKTLVEETESKGRERKEKLQVFFKNWQGVFGLSIVVIFILSSLFASLIAPYDPNALDIPSRLSAPSLEHLAGTDQLGRDTFSRIIYGGRVALKVAIIGISVALVIGVFLGILSGYGPSWLDNALLLIFDAIRAFPTIVLALATVALTGPSLTMVLIIVIITSIPQYARMARTSTLAIKNSAFILAEKAMGASKLKVMLSHILPNIIGPLLILAAMDVPVVVTIEAGLSFLGLGVLPPTASWGTILNEGYLIIRDTPWMVICGGLPLVVTTLGFTFLGEALRDIFDPRIVNKM